MLNKSQLEAVNTINGPVLIIAGAGSGKTHSLISRIENIYNHGVPLENVLMLTFTNKAANEMKSRAAKKLGQACAGLTACTFHSFCVKMLKKYLGNTMHFVILNTNECEDALDIAKNNMLSFLKVSDYERYNKCKKINRNLYKSLLSAYSYSINTETDLYTVLKDTKKIGPTLVDECMLLIDYYEQYKDSHLYLTYDDLMLKFIELLKTDETICNDIKNTYSYIMVDEYQDTNSIQLKILKLMTDEQHNNICVVGDDFQSIYGFRGANFRNILNFKDMFENTKIITLSENYRSNQEILNTANAVIISGKEKFDKSLSGSFSDNFKPRIVVNEDDNAEIYSVYKDILKYKQTGKPLSEYAVLFKTGKETYALESLLKGKGIPYIKRGGPKFFDKEYVRDVLALLRLSYNKYDELAFDRAVQMFYNIGSVNAKYLTDGISSYGIDWLISDINTSKVYYESLKVLHNAILKLSNLNLSEQLKFIEDFYFSQMEYKIINSKMEEATKEESLLQNANNKKEYSIFYEMIKNFSSAEDFVNNVATDNVSLNEDDAIVLSTIHSAKGLEWDNVSLLNCTNICFPYPNDNEDAYEEERRLFYVAITRARHRLVIYAPSHTFLWGRYIESSLSPFLTESNEIVNSYDLKVVI